MAPRREPGSSSRSRGKRPVEDTSATEREGRSKARHDHPGFASREDHERFIQHFSRRRVLPGRDVEIELLSSLGLGDLLGRVGWLQATSLREEVFPTLVRTFYAQMRYECGGPIRSTVRGVEIVLTPDDICETLGVATDGLSLYEAKTWPQVEGFDPYDAIRTICGDRAQRVGRPSASSLSVIGRVIHHMICHIFMPRGGHLDEVSFFEIFLVESILIGRRVHLGHIMMRHMMACAESRTRTLPYGRFLTRIFMRAGVDFSRERDRTLPSPFDTYTTVSLARMHLERTEDGQWVRRDEHQAPQDEEAEIRHMEGGGVPPQPEQPSYEPEDTGIHFDPSDPSEPTFTMPEFAEAFGPSSSDISDLRTRVDEIATRSYEIAARQERIEREQMEQRAILGDIQSMLRTLLSAHHPPPPPADE